MTKNPIARALKKQMRTIDEKLHSIWLTYGEKGISNDPAVREAVTRLLNDHERLLIALREARRAASPVA